MADGDVKEPLYTVRRWADGRAVTLELRTKYLNYDISDELKAGLREVVGRELDGGVRCLVVDLSKVSIVDSCGVGLLIGLHNLARDRAGCLHLTGITHFLQKIFRMMHLDEYFQVVASEEEALRAAPTPAI